MQVGLLHQMCRSKTSEGNVSHHVLSFVGISSPDDNEQLVHLQYLRGGTSNGRWKAYLTGWDLYKFWS